jgi:hypothetical protein
MLAYTAQSAAQPIGCRGTCEMLRTADARAGSAALRRYEQARKFQCPGGRAARHHVPFADAEDQRNHNANPA